MMLMLLLTELTRLKVKLSVEADGLHVSAPAGVLSDELRQAIAEHKAALLCYAAYPFVETIDGKGMLTGTRKETDPLCYGTRQGERLRYKVGVKLVQDSVERFYLPETLWQVQQDALNSDPHTIPAQLGEVFSHLRGGKRVKFSFPMQGRNSKLFDCMPDIPASGNRTAYVPLSAIEE